MVAFTKTRWITLLLVVSFLAAGLLAYQLWQKNEELVKQIELNQDLTTRIDELRREIEEAKRQKAEELARQIEVNQNLKEQVSVLQTEIEKVGKSEKKESGVVIRTDKIEYEKGETAEITVKNGLDESIWYLDAELGGWNPWWGLQKLEKGNWVEVKVHKPIDGECLIIVRERVPIEELIKEMETNVERSNTWTLENCVELSPIGPEIDLKPLALGTYRVFFKYGLNKGSWNEKTVYSDKFVIITD